MFEWRVGGCRVRVGVAFLAVCAAAFTADATRTAAVCLLASLLHESGHIAALILFRCTPRALTFGVGGISLTPGSQPLSYGRQIAVSAAGPAVNFLFAAAFFAARGAAPAVAAHLLLGGFNLLPIEPLDGGQILYACIAARFCEQTAARAVRAVSVCVLLPLATAGFWLLFCFYNPLLLIVCGCLTVRLFGRGVWDFPLEKPGQTRYTKDV